MRGELVSESEAGLRVVFQYNPEAIRRHLTRPAETMEFTLEFDSTDPDVDAGITSPASVSVALEFLSQMMERPDGVKLQWGNRTTPVVIRELSITEECFDADLNPARAVVDVVLEVFSP